MEVSLPMWTQREGGFPQNVEIIEVGLRDGLQREAVPISAAEKLSLINALLDAGLRHIQVTSFVHPRLVPQMADAEEVCAGLPQRSDVTYSGLVLNQKGVERAHNAALKQVDMSVSASDAHSRRNANRSVEEALAEFNLMFDRARAYGMTVRGGIQCAFGYLRTGDVDPERVIEIARHHLDLGVDALTLADSSGLADPRQLTDLLQQILPLAASTPIILHLHDTRGMGLANVLAALGQGVRHFDTAFGGLGGCPFIEGATGNIATEDTVYMLDRMGIATGIDLAKLAAISRQFATRLGRVSLPSKLYTLL